MPAIVTEILSQLLDRFLAADTWEVSQRMVERHPTLLSPEADALLTERIMRLEPGEPRRQDLIDHQQLLGLCRARGVNEGFKDLVANLDPMTTMALLNQLDLSTEAPRRILLLRNFLPLFNLNIVAPMRAMMLDDLGKCLMTTPMGAITANREQALFSFQEALKIRTKATMPLEWAETMVHLGTAHELCPRGDPRKAKKRARGCYEAALELVSAETRPQAWSLAVERLAGLYSSDHSEAESEHLERAIELLTALLENRIRNGSILGAASAALHLANVWRRRIEGSHQENIEHAIEILERSISMLSDSGYKEMWGQTANNLASVLLERARHDHVENVERAIDLLEQAVASLDIELRWTAELNLAIAYSHRPARNKSANLLKASEICQKALDALSEESNRYEVTRAHVGLADVLGHAMFPGDRTENLERALGHGLRALKLMSPHELLSDRHELLVHLSSIYLFRTRGARQANIKCLFEIVDDVIASKPPRVALAAWSQLNILFARACVDWQGPDRALRLERAIDSCRQAMASQPRDENPLLWAEAMTILGEVYGWRIESDRALNLESAIACYEKALEVRDRATALLGWLECLSMLAGAYRDRRLGDRVQNIEKSTQLYRLGASATPVDVMPRYHCEFQGNLGRLLFQFEEWLGAAAAFREALRAIEPLHQRAVSAEARRYELDLARELSGRFAYCLAKLGRETEAIEVLEVNRARELAEALGRNDVLLQKAKPADRASFLAACAKVDNFESKLRAIRFSDTAGSEIFAEISEQLKLGREELADVITAIRSYSPDFLDQSVSASSIAAVATRAERPIVYLVATPHGSIAFVVLPSEPERISIHVIWLNDYTAFDLREQLGAWQTATAQEGQADGLARESERSGWQSAVEELWSGLKDRLLAPLEKQLQVLSLREIVLIPCGPLGLFPVHQFPEVSVVVSVSPSARTFEAAMFRSRDLEVEQRAMLHNFGTPGDDLRFATVEVRMIAAMFNIPQSIVESSPSVLAFSSKMQARKYVHFSGHGIYVATDPLESSLQVGDAEYLTLRNVLDGALDLSGVRLVVLSACETGVFDLEKAPDEMFGLPGAILLAGAAGVVGSLWRVQDISTALLMVRFYDLHLNGTAEGNGSRIAPQKALQQAQTWLRDLSVADLRYMVRKMRSELAQKTDFGGQVGILQARALNDLLARWVSLGADVRPYASPYYWAPFVFVGA